MLCMHAVYVVVHVYQDEVAFLCLITHTIISLCPHVNFCSFSVFLFLSFEALLVYCAFLLVRMSLMVFFKQVALMNHNTMLK